MTMAWTKPVMPCRTEAGDWQRRGADDQPAPPDDGEDEPGLARPAELASPDGIREEQHIGQADADLGQDKGMQQAEGDEQRGESATLRSLSGRMGFPSVCHGPPCTPRSARPGPIRVQ